ncbi:hypothetical protein N7488_004096 [Penicillium malachiteum]|nr:hypothetical protein N7488_004096 [Penicillium malachiteum]
MYAVNMSAVNPLPVFEDDYVEAYEAGMTGDQFGALYDSAYANLTEVNQPTTENLVQDNDYYLPHTLTNEEFVEGMAFLDANNATIFRTDAAMDHEASLETSGILLPTEVVVANAPIYFEANDVSAMNLAANVGTETSDVSAIDFEANDVSAMDLAANVGTETSDVSAIDFEANDVSAMDLAANVGTETSDVSAIDFEANDVSAIDFEANDVSAIDFEANDVSAMDLAANVGTETSDVSMTDAPSDLMDDELIDPETIRALMEFDPRDVQLNQNQGAQVYPDPETPKRNDTQIVYGLPTPGSNSELEEAQAPATASTTTPATPPETTTVNLTECSIESLPGHQTQFSSLAAIRESMRQVDRRHHPEDDKSIPTTAEEKQVLVGKLIVVLKNMEGIRDGEAAIRTFNNRNFTDVDFELTAWEILEAMLTRHQFGASLTPAHAKRKTGRFEDRFLSACNALNCSKSVAKHCLDPEFVKTFVDHPQGALGRVIGNQKINERKGVLLKAGKEAMSK